MGKTIELKIPPKNDDQIYVQTMPPRISLQSKLSSNHRYLPKIEPCSHLPKQNENLASQQSAARYKILYSLQVKI